MPGTLQCFSENRKTMHLLLWMILVHNTPGCSTCRQQGGRVDSACAAYGICTLWWVFSRKSSQQLARGVYQEGDDNAFHHQETQIWLKPLITKTKQSQAWKDRSFERTLRLCSRCRLDWGQGKKYARGPEESHCDILKITHQILKNYFKVNFYV